MDNLSKQYVISFFNRHLDIFGNRPEALRWTHKGQQEHYRNILEVDKFIRGSSILDFGCGKGDLYGYIKERGIDVKYTGIDINESLINLATTNHPEARFLCLDILQDKLDELFDHIIICGVFNLKFQDIENTVKEILTKLFAICKNSLAFNALSAHNPQKEYELNYLYPEELFKFAVTTLSPYVSLRHDSMNYVFNLFIYRQKQEIRE
ncbi:MAG TPA: class I SAM-dependent methyltransferase [Nitrospirae bacterium]|nr:class I SAM-dependent methyltransferase [Nitrospirota bacterium]